MNFDVSFKDGDIIQGIVTSIKKYGVFFSFDGGYIGLLHISEISNNFVNDISKGFSLGDCVNLKILTIDKENKFLNVSLKQVNSDLNNIQDFGPSKKMTSYFKETDFSKLEKSLPDMIKKELEREKL